MQNAVAVCLHSQSAQFADKTELLELLTGCRIYLDKSEHEPDI